MSNLATQARAIALIARQAVPTAVTVQLESSDQGDFLTTSTPWVIDADGNEHDDPPDEFTDELWNRTCDIKWGDADGTCPGWTHVNKRGGYYELNIDAILAVKPKYQDSLLALTIDHFQHLIDVIPSEPPIIMAEVDDVSYRATFTPQAIIKGEAVDVDPEGETTWTVSEQSHYHAGEIVDAGGSTDGNDSLREDRGAPAWVHRWSGPFTITVERLGTPRILSMTAHCPRCGSSELAEMDWATRWNDFSEVEFGEDGRSDDLFVGVGQDDGEYETLVHFCKDCGQVLDLSDLDIEPVW